MKIISAILLIAFAAVATAAPPIVHLAWDDPGPEESETLAGYRVYLGTASGEYTQIVDIPEVEFKAKLEDLIVGQTYFCAVTAYNKFGLESDYSNEISFDVIPKPGSPAGLRIDVTVQVTVDVTQPEPAASP